MQLRNGRFVRTDIWREGTYLDLWSVPHFLSGMAVALGLALLGLELYAATVVAFFLLVLWEIFEYVAGIEEGRMNSMMDVVVGMTSFAPTFYWSMTVSWDTVLLAFIAVFTVDLMISTVGWVATRKAYVLEHRLRMEFEERRAQVRERRRSINARITKERGKWRERRKQWKARRKAVRERRSQDSA